MTINAAQTAVASKRDRALLRTIHPIGVPILNTISAHKPLMRIPGIGVVVSDAAMIREILLDRKNYTKVGEGVASSFWTPILGRQGLINMDGEEHKLMKRTLAASFSNTICPAIVATVMASSGQAFKAKLLAGATLDIVQEVDRFAYRTMWAILGLPQAEVSGDDFDVKVAQLKAVIEGVTVTKKTLPGKQVRIANEKLARIDAVTRQAYREAVDASSIPGLLKAEGYDEDAAVSIVKVMMIAGTETIVGFLPRMTALFIDSGYINHLVQEPHHLLTGINEAMRYTMPTAVDARSAVHDNEFHGLQVKRGERMVLSLINAGLRYGDFNPFQELDRTIRGLWFGAGVHVCIGLPLAFAEAEAFSSILIEAATRGRLEIVRRQAATSGHLGAYKRLEIRCALS